MVARLREGLGRFMSAVRVSRNGHSAAAADPDTPSPSGLIGKVAPISQDTADLLSWYGGTQPNPDSMMGRLMPSDTAYYLMGFGLYEEMKDKDPTLLGLLNQRQRTVLAAQEMLQPADDSPEALTIRDFIAQAMKEIKNWGHARAELWMAVYYGVSYLEIDWQPTDITVDDTVFPDRILPKQLWSRRRGRFVYDDENNLQLLSGSNATTGKPVPQGKFLDFAPYRRYENPYGVALARVLWFYHNAKKAGFRWLVVHTERYGSPFAVIKHSPNATAEDLATIDKVLQTLKTGSGVRIEEGTDFELHNPASGSSQSLPHETLIKLNDEQMAIATVGQTLTVKQGDKGARSLGEVHMDVRADIVQGDADALSAGIQRLVDLMVELNFGTTKLHLAPRYTINTKPKSAEQAKVRFETGRALKLKMSMKQAHGDLQLDVAKDDDDTIKFGAEPTLDPLAANTEAAAKGVVGKTPVGWIESAQIPQAAYDALSLGPDRIPGLAATFALQEKQRAASVASIRDILPGPIQTLYTSGVAAQSRVLGATKDGIPEFTRGWILEQLAAAGIGPDDAFFSDPAELPWDEFELPSAMQDKFVDRMNDDLTIAELLGHSSVFDYVDANTTASAALNPLDHMVHDTIARMGPLKAAADGDPGSTNPLITALYGQERIIPRRVLSVANRMVQRGMSWDNFYRLDALGRSASFTAWDLLQADVRHLGGAFQDAINWGYTSQGYADYIYNRLKPRYVTQPEASLHAWHIETIYGTNFAKVYNQAQTDEAWEFREDFPYLQFVNPDPQFPACVEMAGGVWRTDSATVQNYTPPLHFNCGSSWQMLTDDMLEETGQTVNTSPPVEQPMIYSGPGGEGVAAPFGAWAPLEVRYAHLEEEIARLGAPS